MDDGERDTQGNVTRRDFLRASGCAVAGLSAGVSLAQAQGEKPLLRFGIVTDSHYADADANGDRPYRESLAKMHECVAAMNDQKVDFLIEIGDFKDQRASAVEAETLGFLEAIELAFAKFKGPRYHALGNHDVDSISKTQFLAHVENSGIARDASYYSFDTKGVHFVVLDTCYKGDGIEYDHGNFDWTDCNVPPEELAWLENDLASTTRPVIVFSHHQLDGDDVFSVRNAPQVREILNKAKNVLVAFHGHNHAGRHRQLDGIHYYTLKAMVEGSGEDNNSYATVEVHSNHDIIVSGYRKAVSMHLDTT